MAEWVRCCRTILDWDDQPLLTAPPARWADPRLIHHCGRVDTGRVYGDETLAEAFEELWTCPCCGGDQFEFADWPPRGKLGGPR
jgi:hypothetical protein